MLERALIRRGFRLSEDDDYCSRAQALRQAELKNKANDIIHRSEINSLLEGKVCPLNREREEKKEKREAARQTAGKGWFGMKAPQLTEEARLSNKALQMRDLMFSKKFYRKNDESGKFFTYGRVQDDAFEFKDKRLTRKQRKGTLAQELLAVDAENKFSRKKFLNYQEEREKLGKRKKALKMKLLRGKRRA